MGSSQRLLDEAVPGFVLLHPQIRAIRHKVITRGRRIAAGLPQDTLLEEVVALNVGPKHVEYLQRLLEPYPTVKSFEM